MVLLRDIPDDKFVPDDGVYITDTDINGYLYPSVTNIGKAPTFMKGTKKCETFVIGFSGEIYGEGITIRFHEFLRGERKFNSVKELAEQISRDAKAAEGYRIAVRKLKG